MDTLLKFPGRASCQGIQSHVPKGLALRSLSHKTTCNFDSHKMEIQPHALSFNRKTQHKFRYKERISAMSSNRGSKLLPNSFSPSEKVEQFYTCINEKNLPQLAECISDNTQFHDYSFIKPFQGKKEVMQFLEQLTASMGQNVKFSVGHICEGADYTATANWHLEWKRAQIPFTRGCSFFKCSKEGETITITKAEVLIESPIKPGSIALKLLKTVTSLFDDFPRAAEWFLRSPHAVLKWIINIYTIIIAPIFNPILDGYIKLWSFGARLLGYIFNIAIFISKLFFK